jgi:hypothetical protein
VFTRDSVIISYNIKTPLTSISRAVGNILQLTHGQPIDPVDPIDPEEPVDPDKPLFSNGEQGFFYDPNDLSTMLQDSAGTVPVTGAGQPVGLILDKSKELALGSELITNGDFSDGMTGWVVKNGTSTATIVNGAARLTATSSTSPQLSMPTAFLADKYVEVSVDFMNRTGGSRVYIGLSSTESTGVINSVVSTKTSGSVKFRARVPSNFNGGLYCRLNSPTEGSYIDFDNISVKEIVGNHAYQTTSASRPILQRNATTGAYYLAFDGADDFLQTNNIDFTATDKVSLFAGVRKLTDAVAMIVELSSAVTSNNGTFYLARSKPIGVSDINYSFATKGTLVTYSVVDGFAAPHSAILTANGVISSDVNNFEVNGKLASTTGDQGTGNYGKYPLYIGRRGGSSIPFNGHIYGLIGVGKLVSDNETASIEKELAKRVGVTLNV